MLEQRENYFHVMKFYAAKVSKLNYSNGILDNKLTVIEGNTTLTTHATTFTHKYR